MRLAVLAAAFALTARTASAQEAPPTADSSRLQIGTILGISNSGFSQSVGRIGGASGKRGTGPYVGLFARRKVARDVNAELELAFEVKSDGGDGFSMPYLQLPVVVEYLPFSPRRMSHWVRPVILLGGSAGVRLHANGGSGEWAPLRAGELSVMLGLGVTTHLASTDWFQLLLRLQSSVSDLSASPGRTSSNLLVAYVKLHHTLPE